MFSQVTVVEDSLFSPSLNSFTKYYAILPDGYSKVQERYPVLYLLHGLTGNYTNWVKYSNIVRYAKEYQLIIVTPDGKNGWYTNSHTQQNAKYEDQIMNDLIPNVEKKYRTIQSKFSRAIAGLSMGAYGAIKFGLKYPDKFFFVGGMSPAIQFPKSLEDSAIIARRSKESTLNLQDIFGTVRNESWEEDDVFSLVDKSTSTSLPYFYLSIGSQDGILELVDLTHNFAAALRRKKIAFEMHETAGAHEWKFWDKEIEIILKRIAELSGKKK
ncbi:MAG: alpha/beta hydrolase family protein [Bacteroidota bacterium]